MWWRTAAALGVLASGCGDVSYVAVVLIDGGVDGGFPTDPTPDDPDPPPDAGVSHVDELLELAWSDEDFQGLQGENRWSYGYWQIDVTAAPIDAPSPGDVSQPDPATPGGGADTLPQSFRELPVLEDRAAFEPGAEWGREDGRPWLYVAAGGAHPWGPITLGGVARDELWAVRRWRAPAAGEYFVYVEAASREGQEGCAFGDGTRVSIWRGTTRLAHLDVPPPGSSGGASLQVWAQADLDAFEPLDVAVEPRGNDVCDATRMRVGIYERRPFD